MYKIGIAKGGTEGGGKQRATKRGSSSLSRSAQWGSVGDKQTRREERGIVGEVEAGEGEKGTRERERELEKVVNVRPEKKGQIKVEVPIR